MAHAFSRSGWIDSDRQFVKLTQNDVEATLRSRIGSMRDFDRFGLDWVGVAADEDKPPIMIKIAMGGSEWAQNDFSVDFTQTQELPDLNYFRRSIEIIRPFEAYVHSTEQAWSMREKMHRPLPPSDLPKIVYWFHYLNGEMVAAVGGLAHCLGTPAYKCEKFLDGVLIQLTEIPFDLDNADHIAAQWNAMEHLGLTKWYATKARSTIQFPKNYEP
jgi:hypothetical protein